MASKTKADSTETEQAVPGALAGAKETSGPATDAPQTPPETIEAPNIKATTANAPTGAQAARKWPYEALKAQCTRLFGVSRSTFVAAVPYNGGLYDETQVREKITSWLKKEVK